MIKVFVVGLGILALEGSLGDEGYGQVTNPETRAIMATAIRAVLIPDIPGKVLISTTIHTVVNDNAAAALARDLGATAIAKAAAFDCARNPQTLRIDKRTCKVAAGQLVEVRAIEQSGSSAHAIVRLYTNEGARAPTARQFRVEMKGTPGGTWHVVKKTLIEIT